MAAKGHSEAIAALEAPPFPSELLYLWEWSLALHGQSGFDANGGFLPLGYLALYGWAMLTGEIIRAHEVDALMQLDRARLYPRDLDAVGKANGDAL